MRIVAGALKGQRIEAPKGRATRPTGARLREAVFAMLEARGAAGLQGGRVLDLFAGTGALGLEALSRGADFAAFVDMDKAALTALQATAKRLGVRGAIAVMARDATRLPPCKSQPFDLVFLDAPYGKALSEKTLGALIRGAWLKRGALVVVEVAADEAFNAPPDFTVLAERIQGAGRVVLLQGE
jgi:16S rRNA (guanine966-N2)-methyltransferase